MLRKSGEAADSAGEQAAAVNLAAPLSDVPGALKGSRSAESAVALADAWHNRLKGWSAAATSLGSAVARAADLYEADHEAARHDLLVIAAGWITP
ncbi:hypothetical protein GCM10027445_44350 [Amycolatopsis endophytica]